MLRKSLLLIAAFAFLIGGTVVAEDCVDVDIELSSEPVGEANLVNGFVEIVNCGDEAALIDLNVTITVGSFPPFTLGTIVVPVGAGESISREFRFAAPPLQQETEVQICLTALSGEAEASDCASIVFGGTGGTSSSDKEFVFQMSSSSSSDCVDVDLEVSDTVVTEPGDFFAETFFELVNCGDTAALITLELTVDGISSFPPLYATVPLGAGESVSRELRFPVPPAVPEGEYSVTLTATAGAATSSVTELIVVLQGSVGGGDEGGSGSSEADATNYPNPFNPSTNISYSLPTSGQVTLKIYNVLGEEVKTLVNEYKPAGSHNVVWDATNHNGTSVSSGTYFYRLITDESIVNKKMLLVR